MPIQRENLSFGQGSFVGDILKDPSFFNEPVQKQAEIIGWAIGCPVVQELTDPSNTTPGRGPEAMLKRYGEIGLWHGFILETVEELNPVLDRKMAIAVDRLPDEPVGKYEADSVPAAYLEKIPATETLAGYTLPRLMIKQIGRGLPKSELQDRMARGIEAFEEAIPKAETPEELLALAAGNIAKADVEPIEVLKTILPTGWMEEHNGRRSVDDAKVALRDKAPELWAVYSSLAHEERVANKIL